jgi:hypothetical protein
MAAIYSNGGNRWNILGLNFTSKRDALSSVYKISMDSATFAVYSSDNCCMVISRNYTNQKKFSRYRRDVKGKVYLWNEN